MGKKVGDVGPGKTQNHGTQNTEGKIKPAQKRIYQSKLHLIKLKKIMDETKFCLPHVFPPLAKQPASAGEQTARGGWSLNRAQGASAYFFHFAVIREFSV